MPQRINGTHPAQVVFKNIAINQYLLECLSKVFNRFSIFFIYSIDLAAADDVVDADVQNLDVLVGAVGI